MPRDQVVFDDGKEEKKEVEEEKVEKDKGTYEQYVRASRAVVKILGLEPAEQVLVVNGRVSPRPCLIPPSSHNLIT